MSTSIRIAIAATLVAAAVGAGTSLAGPPQKTSSTVTLTLANPDGRGRPASMIAEAFATRVKALSKGTLVVKIAYGAGGASESIPRGRLEANLIGLVRSGKDALALIPTRAFQAQGVTSFEALQAPFLITTNAAMDRVTAGRVAVQLQSGLPALGLTGLGLAPEGLRRPFGFEKPLAAPGDFAGIEISAISSRPTWLLLRALGARPVDLNGNAMERAVQNGTVKGVELSLALAADDGLRAYTAGNLAFFPKIDALVGNAAALKRLSSDQESILTAAAASARSWAVSVLTEKHARDAYCKLGGTVVNAPSSGIAALSAKAAPVLAEMRRDPLTRSLIAEIGPSGSSGAGVVPCSHPSSPGTSPGPTVTAVIPAGVYRKAITEQQLLAAGASPTDAKGNGGTSTLTVTSDGYQSIHLDSPYPENTGTCDKRKMYLRHGLVVIEIRGQQNGCNGDFAVAWKLAPGGIEFTRVSIDTPILNSYFAGVFWKRVG